MPKYGTVLYREYVDDAYTVMFVKIDEKTWEGYNGFKAIRLKSSNFLSSQHWYEGWWDNLNEWTVVDEA